MKKGVNHLGRILAVLFILSPLGEEQMSLARWIRWGEGWRRLRRCQLSFEECPMQTGLVQEMSWQEAVKHTLSSIT